jgi:type IV pilus biogenesis protein CpaD/CtpE
MYFKFLLFAAFALLLSGCAQMLPGLFSAVEDIETQEAISLTVDKEAIQKDTDVKISIEVTNKDPVVTYPGLRDL